MNTINKLALGLSGGVAVVAVLAALSGAVKAAPKETGRVDIKLEETNGELLKDHCEWSVRNEDQHTEVLSFHGSRLKQTMAAGRYIADLDCDHDMRGSAGFTVKKRKTTRKRIVIRQF